MRKSRGAFLAGLLSLLAACTPAASGRPVDVITGKDGALYVSDDRAGVIHRISSSTR